MRYTVGNPLGYERALDGDDPVMKQVGGIVFDTREAAEAALIDGMLDPKWFNDGEPRPGRVYGLTGDPPVCTNHYGDGRHYLMRPAPVVRLP